MKNLKYLVCITVLIPIFVNISYGANIYTGTSSADFLKIDGSARSAAMGGAFIAVSDDPDGIYYNPAGIVQIASPEVSSYYSNWIAGISQANLSFVLPVSQSVFGFSISRLSAGAIEETTLASPTGTGNIITPTDYSCNIVAGRALNKNVYLGASVKYLEDNISDSKLRGFAGDVGMLCKPRDCFAFGMVARNVVGAISSSPLPSVFGAGVCFRGVNALMAIDINIPRDNNAELNAGVEYNYKNILFGRAGFNTRAETGAGGNISLGVGIRLKSVRFDYANVPYGDFGSTHRFSFSVTP